MPPKKKNSNPKVLEGFTYEEISDTVDIEIPQEVIDESEILEPLNDQKELPPQEEKSPSTIEFELPNIKEPEPNKNSNTNSPVIDIPIIDTPPVRKSKRNSTRKIKLSKLVIDLDHPYVEDRVTIDFETYAELIKDYIFKAMVLQILYTMRDNDSMSDQEIVDLFNSSLQDTLGNIIQLVLEAHKTIESISGLVETSLEFGKSDHIKIQIDLDIKYPNHLKLYTSSDTIIIPI